ncbi:MAG TPA: hypothetical protein ENK85_08365 [Saprospiraceae bacterium]|nr:hypothetical protein [Saprospiraceae bacterium]
MEGNVAGGEEVFLVFGALPAVAVGLWGAPSSLLVFGALLRRFWSLGCSKLLLGLCLGHKKKPDSWRERLLW